jgi:lipopolysaccharide export LptBFGC system permease protein LptF
MLRLDPAGSISTSILGVYYGTLLEKTGSLWPAILGSITVSILTFSLSQFGLRYGYGGEPYPVSWLVVAGAVAVAAMVALLGKPPRTGKPD